VAALGWPIYQETGEHPIRETHSIDVGLADGHYLGEILMARANFVKRARKDNPVVSRGESYWWWQFAFGSKQYSKIQPKRSQLTQSSFLAQLYDLEDTFEFDSGNLEESRSDLISQLEGLRDECQDSLDNMPEHLRDTSDSGILLQERIENLDEWISNLENVDLEDLEPTENLSDTYEHEADTVEDEYFEEIEDDRDARLQEKIEDLEDCKTF